MPRLHHFALDPFCRRIRLALAIKGVEVALIDERPWAPREALYDLNPAGTVPVYQDDAGHVISGAEALGEFIEETLRSPPLYPGGPAARAEVRRLIAWFDVKFQAEVTGPVLVEKVMKKFLSGSSPPDMAVLRASLAQMRSHLDYLAWLAEERAWLAGPQISMADLAAAAHVSSLDYLGCINWDDVPVAKSWYERMKSQPWFRVVLGDQVAGMALRPIMRPSISDIAAKAKAEGFDACAIAPAKLPAEISANLSAFVEAGHHGTMDWLAETAPRRASPDAMWQGARSAIVLAANYDQGLDAFARLEARSTGVISQYALNRDYHDVIKGRLKRMAAWFAKEAGADVKVFVDTAPLMEKPLAALAGLGWQGKHTNLVSRTLGSWFFLGVILTDADLPRSNPEQDHCGTCTACLDICPTKAFIGPHKLDARRCISYLTIEHKCEIPVEFRKAMGNRIYGCDDCLAICPWNKFAAQSREAKFAAREDLVAPALAELLALDDAAFRAKFSGSPVKRIGRDSFIRNCLIAAGNSGDAALLASVVPLKSDPAPVVAEAARWAEGELTSRRPAPQG